MSRLFVQGEQRAGRDWASLPPLRSTAPRRVSIAAAALLFLIGLLIGILV